MRSIWRGGASRRFWEIHKRLVKKGYDITVLGSSTLSKYNPKVNSLNEHEGIKINSIRTKLPFPDYLFYIKAMAVIKSIHKDFDVIHDDFSPTGCYSFLWHDRCIATIHETFGRYALNKYGIAGLVPLLNEKFYKKMGYKVFIVCAPSVRKNLRSLGINSTLIPGGADTELFKPGRKDNNDIIVTMVTRLSKGKGLDLFIEIARGLVSKYQGKDIKFMLVGDGNLISSIQRKINRLRLNIKLANQVSDEELVKILQNSSIYLHTSLQEGFGLSICEAMACGLPVVAFNVLGVKDLVNPRTGILIPPGDIKGAIDALYTLINDEDLRKNLGRNARNLILEKYRWERSSALMDEVYKSLIN
jgi:glycosyltransferase involved in cell wall biosynthesis